MAKDVLYSGEIDRAKAMDRAFLISKLFRREYFDRVVAAINESDKKKAVTIFGEACKDAGLTEKQMIWLWNYLKYYNKGLAWNSPAGPINGW